MPITVLRLGHRIERDKRISTHVGLVARAMGCSKLIYSGQRDKNLEQSIKKVVKQWGGPFEIRYTKNWKQEIRKFKGMKIHLSVYGIPFQKKIPELRKKKDIMLIVGGEKVQPEVYHMADMNLAVSSQPHSEVSSLCLFLDYYFKGKELGKRFKKAKLKVIPQERGKKVVRAAA
jgi:tRNA (cytidine56-2'-O)-methyltransferase